jgi:type II secretory pathway component PulC
MKNKKNIYILLPAVLVIWGLVGYRIFSAVSPKTTTKEQNTVYTFTPKPLNEQEHFTIQADYRDPFLGTLVSLKKMQQLVKKVEKPISKEPFPVIEYKGLVSGNDGANQVFIISVNGQQYFYKKNAIHGNVKLLSGNKKQVVLHFQGQRQTVEITQ